MNAIQTLSNIVTIIVYNKSNDTSFHIKVLFSFMITIDYELTDAF